MTEAARALSVFLVAGEESGDALGGALARALVAAAGGALKLAGVGGRAMAAAGISSPFPIDDLAIIGITAIPRRLPMLLLRIRETADAIIAARPDVLVIIDSPEFTHRVARRVRARAPGIAIIDYVSPSVWAWRPGRARAMRAYVDCVLAILPFEPEAYARLDGAPCVYVGHPLAERTGDLRPSAVEMQRRLADPPLLLVLPGSRSGEIRRLLAIFGAAVSLLVARVGPVELVLPTLPHLESQVRVGVAGWAVKPRIVIEGAEKWAAFRAARAALAASGTVTLELALAGVPMVAAYRLPLIEEIIMRMLSTLDTVILANLVIGENVVPEFLQRDCAPEQIAGALELLFSDTPERLRQVEAFRRLDRIMALEASPSAKAATIVLKMARSGRRDLAGPTAD
jgi:lipid-A-disaccharide synthase